MKDMNWMTAKFLVVGIHEQAGAAWGKALDDVLAELLKFEEESPRQGMSITLIGLYKRLGQLNFSTLDEFERMVHELEHKYSEI